MTTLNLSTVSVPRLVPSNTNSRRDVVRVEGSHWTARVDAVVTRLANGREARHFVILLDNGAGRPVYVSRAKFDQVHEVVRHVLIVRKALAGGAHPAQSARWQVYAAPTAGFEYVLDAHADAELAAPDTDQPR
jgi:hypothetical protein